MKPSYNIAVCFSGESRSFLAAEKYIKDFLKSEIHTVTLYCHTWDSNHWKIKNNGIRSIFKEDLDAEVLKNELKKLYNFKAIVVSPSLPDTIIRLKNGFDDTAHSISQFKSLAIANNLKTQDEIAGNFIYDIVFRLRLDTIPPIEYTLNSLVSRLTKPLTDEVIINQHSSGSTEYRVPWCEDTIFYGSSLGMDIICDLYFYYASGKFFEMCDCSIYNNAIGRYGPNALLYKWATFKNVKMSRCDCLHIPSAIPIRYGDFALTYEEIKWKFLND